MARHTPPQVLVERALALVPDSEEFLPLSDAVIGASQLDREKLWAGSGQYATLGKRVVSAEEVGELIPRIVEKTQQRLKELFSLVLEAIQQQHRGDLTGAARTLIRAGGIEEGDGRLDKAEKLYGMALDISRDLREKGPQLAALRRLGRTARSAFKLDEAWSWYQQAYDLAVDQLDPAAQAEACLGLGNLCDDRGQRDEARSWSERGLRLALALEDVSLEWRFLANLSVFAVHRGELAEADAMLERARERIVAMGDDEALPFWYNNRALLLLEAGDVEGAEAALREALGRGQPPMWELTMRVNLGDALVRQGRLFEAAEEARRAEELAILNRFVPDLVDVYVLLGSIARARCDEEGFVFYEQALSVCHERGLPRKTEASILHGYGLLHAGCGRPAEARAYLETASDIYRELGFAPELEKVRADLEGLEAKATA
ncbi:MAG TPA: tetratricopeptide repeat protein [Longimicrobiaceae bacterium]|nr:tetratricopeptide repeat protein [Longimicrobiaceae bacterium]